MCLILSKEKAYMDSNIEKKFEEAESILSVQKDYIKALKISDADVSESTLEEFISDLVKLFEDFQDKAVNDMCKKVNEQIENNNNNTQCKFVSLF